MALMDRLRSRTLPALVRQLAQDKPSQRAVLADDGELTFPELHRQAEAFARALVGQDIGAGDAVGILLPNGARWFVSVLGTQYAGAVAVLLNTWSKARELQHCVNLSKTKLIIADRTALGRDFNSVLHEADLLLPRDRAEYRYLGTRYWPVGAPLPEDMPPTDAELSEVTETATAYILFTSGSTAQPKGVPLIHRDLLVNGYEIGERHRFVESDRLWIASPFFFSMGSVNAVPSVFTHGASFCVQERYEAESTLDLLERERCTIYYGLPPMTRALLASPTLKERDLSALHTGMGAMSRQDKIEAIEQLGLHGMCSVYGATETYTLCTITEPDDLLEIKLNTQGYPLPSQQVRIFGEDDVAAVGIVGEIEVRGCTTPGYLGLTGEDAARQWRDGWFRTGDLGSLDEDGRLRFIGRNSDTMKTNGILVAPAEVEATIGAHPSVSDVFVFGLPDAERGEAIAAVVVPAEWNSAAIASLQQDLPSYVRSQVASYKVPRFIWFMRANSLPLTDTGKVRRRGLVEAALSEDWRAGHPAGGVIESLGAGHGT